MFVYVVCGYEVDLWEGGFDGFDVGGVEEFGGENFDGVGVGFLSVEDFGGGEGVVENGDVVVFVDFDYVGMGGWGDDEFCFGEDVGVGGFGVEYGVEVEDEIG